MKMVYKQGGQIYETQEVLNPNKSWKFIKIWESPTEKTALEAERLFYNTLHKVSSELYDKICKQVDEILEKKTSVDVSIKNDVYNINNSVYKMNQFMIDKIAFDTWIDSLKGVNKTGKSNIKKYVNNILFNTAVREWFLATYN